MLRLHHFAILLALGLLAGCEPGALPSTAGGERSDDALQWAEHQSLADRADAELRQAQQQLHESVNRFLRKPELKSVQVLRENWLNLHRAITRLEFYQQHRVTERRLARRLRRIDQWPIAPGFLDNLPEYPDSGIINDMTLPMNRSTLEAQHMLTDSQEVSLGLHALEFLLWQRSIDDYQPAPELTPQQRADGLLLEHLGTNRRRIALRLIVDVLGFDIERVRARLGETAKQEPDQPDVGASMRWAMVEVRQALTVDAEGRTHSQFSSYDLEEARLLGQLMIDTHDRDTNSRAVLGGIDEQAEESFHQALLHFHATSRAVMQLDAASRQQLITTAGLLEELYAELVPPADPAP